MAQVIMAKQFSKDLDVDGSLKAQSWEFCQKLMADHRAGGLHIEPINGSADDRVRTGRVTQNYRAVLFLVDPDVSEPTFLIAAIKKHDEANRLAERLVLKFNPVNGLPELTETVGAATPPTARAVPASLRADINWFSPMLAFSEAELTLRVGISPEVAAAVRSSQSESLMFELIDSAPGWQSDALLSLATGVSIDDVIEEFSLDRTAPVGDIAAAFDLPAAQMDFTRITSDDDLIQVLSGSFADWRTYLHPDQRKYAYRPSYSGAFRLTGGAGTGKTVVALHRARYLAQANPQAGVVLTTFTTTLAENLLRSFEELDPTIPLAAKLGDPGVLVVGVDKLAVAALRLAGSPAIATVAPHFAGLSGTRITPLPESDDREIWSSALTDSGDELRPELAHVGFLSGEYRTVVLGQSVTTVEQYAAVSRPGRGTRLSRADRIAIWQVVERYRTVLGERGAATFTEIAAIAGAALALDPSSAPADHVVVDEAQDLHAGHWRLLRSLVAVGPDDLFICEDSHQRIYGEKIALSQLGIAIRGRSRRLTLNYRTTRENLGFALGVLAGANVTDLEGVGEQTAGYRSAMRGPVPLLVAADSQRDEVSKVGRILTDWIAEPGIEPESLAVLVRDQTSRDRIATALAAAGLPAQVIKGSARPEAGKVQVLTMHRAKGLEFKRVILPGVSDGRVPRKDADNLPDAERRDAADRERFLLYVAATRARDALVVIWTGIPSSLLPSNVPVDPKDGDHDGRMADPRR